MLNKDDKERLFEKNFLLANINLDIVFGMLFLIMNNIDINFKLRTDNKNTTPLETYF